MFIDARKMGTMVSRKLRELTDDDIKKISDTYEAFADGTLEDVKGFCAVADTAEIEKQDYILTPGRYVGIEEQEDDGEPFEEKMDRLTSELSEMFAKSHMSWKEKLGRNWGRLGMRYKLSDICFYAKGKVDVSGLTDADYISTENMMPNKGGVTIASSLPSTAQTQAYRKDDVLVSNIRPYFKKIWFANCNGGCSNDVLVFRAKEDTDARFLYYVLADDAFFDYSTATSKGTKMPRGDKTAIMQYEVPHFDLPIQKKIAGILADIDNKISLNNNINKNLEQQAQASFS